MKPYVAGEGAVLRAYRGKKKILAKSLTFKAVDGGAAGVATVKVASKVAGSLAVKVSHKATPAVGTLRAKTLRVNIVAPVRQHRLQRPGRALVAGQAGGAEVRRAAHRRL